MSVRSSYEINTCQPDQANFLWSTTTQNLAFVMPKQGSDVYFICIILHLLSTPAKFIDEAVCSGGGRACQKCVLINIDPNGFF